MSGRGTGVDAHGAADQGCFAEAHGAPINHKVTDAACEGSARGQAWCQQRLWKREEMKTKIAGEPFQAQMLLWQKYAQQRSHHQDDLHVKMECSDNLLIFSGTLSASEIT